MKSKSSLKKGSIAYVYIASINAICKATVDEKLTLPYAKDVFSVEHSDIVGRNGKSFGKFCGHTVVFDEDIWCTAEEAYKALDERNENAKKLYCEQIKTVKDLLSFPFVHSFYEEHRNDIAVAAYKQRAQELLGINLDT